MKQLAFTLMLALAASFNAVATTTITPTGQPGVFQAVITPSEDTSLSWADQYRSFGSSNTLFMGLGYDMLINWSLGALPSDAQVTDASIKMTSYNPVPQGYIGAVNLEVILGTSWDEALDKKQFTDQFGSSGNLLVYGEGDELSFSSGDLRLQMFNFVRYRNGDPFLGLEFQGLNNLPDPYSSVQAISSREGASPATMVLTFTSDQLAAAVPEPGTIGALTMGLGLLVTVTRFRRK